MSPTAFAHSAMEWNVSGAVATFMAAIGVSVERQHRDCRPWWQTALVTALVRVPGVP
jgi:hypothetical protein